ncbi:MAG TPA: hypothetical protein VKU00_29435 [Chthonomonadaceae bacterium]|nr:hypothetical protein [Chthonomonadaceae bacterium]
MAEDPKTEATQDEDEKELQPGQSGNMGVVKGIPGKQIRNVGVLDLRGVTAEQIAQVESIGSVGVVLIDENLRTAMTHIATTDVGSLVEISSDYRVMLEPWIEFSKATLEAMPSGQKLVLVGIALFKPDVPAALAAEKFEALQVVGILLASPGVQGALMSKLQITGVSVTIAETEMSITHSLGQNKVTAGYLSYLADGGLYINIGQTMIEADVPAELLASKFAAYYNIGQTIAPAPLLDLLKARCTTNLGQFSTPEEESAEE